MSRKEFAVWLACLLLITLGAAVLCVWMLPGCNAAKVAESVKVEAGHGEGSLDWANSQRSAETQQNWVAVGFNPFAGVAAEPRDPIWTTGDYPREPPAPVVVTVPSAPEPDPPNDEGDSTTLIVTTICTAIVTVIGVWQRQHVVAGVKKLVGRKTEEAE